MTPVELYYFVGVISTYWTGPHMHDGKYKWHYTTPIMYFLVVSFWFVPLVSIITQYLYPIKKKMKGENK